MTQTWQQAKREQRLKIFERLGEALGRETKSAKLRWSTDPESLDSYTIYQGARPGEVALRLARDACFEFKLLGTLDFRLGQTHRKTGYGQHAIEDGEVVVLGSMRFPNGSSAEFEIPIQIHGRKAMKPSVLYVSGVPHILAQSTFDEIAKEGRIQEFVTDRVNMFSPPPQMQRKESERMPDGRDSWRCESCGHRGSMDKEGKRVCGKCGWHKKEAGQRPAHS